MREDRSREPRRRRRRGLSLRGLWPTWFQFSDSLSRRVPRPRNPADSQHERLLLRGFRTTDGSAHVVAWLIATPVLLALLTIVIGWTVLLPAVVVVFVLTFWLSRRARERGRTTFLQRWRQRRSRRRMLRLGERRRRG
ncbi:MAG: hypothetical protein KAI24_13690 [Planctomycetes bacterium]|nr:hypothetical protein [Planctomycetota bacterium]